MTASENIYLEYTDDDGDTFVKYSETGTPVGRLNQAH